VCVVGQHASGVLPWAVHDGMQAVQIFYIISGFYMAMVLSSDRYADTRRFYISRFLRIFPVTWVVLAGVAGGSGIIGLITGHWVELAPYVSGPFAHNGVLGVWIAALSNITLFGQDWVMFLSHPVGGSLHVTRNFWLDTNPLFFLLVIPQAWSVGLELCFYLLVPFINRLTTGTIAGLAGASLIARLLAYRVFDLAADPWTYRFFPFELSHFLLGMLAFRLYVATRGRVSMPPVASTFRGFAIVSVFALTIFYGAARCIELLSRPIPLAYATLLTYPLWAILIVGLFVVSRSNRFDRTIGELSFPVYLVHYFIISIAREALRITSLPHSWLGPVSALSSVAAAIVLFKFCTEPIDRARHVLTVGRPE
jgi:peptidoglycan/LPS O-acetylase OafA/YrhL